MEVGGAEQSQPYPAPYWCIVRLQEGAKVKLDPPYKLGYRGVNILLPSGGDFSWCVLVLLVFF